MFEKLLGKNKKKALMMGESLKEANPELQSDSKRDYLSEWTACSAMTIMLHNYSHTSDVDLKAYESMTLEAFLSFCTIMGGKSLGVRLDEIIFDIPRPSWIEPVLNLACEKLHKTLKELKNEIKDGREILLLEDMDDPEKYDDAEEKLEKCRSKGGKVKKEIKALKKMQKLALTAVQAPPGEGQSGGRLYYWLPYLREIMKKDIEEYRFYLEATNYRLLIALESGDDDLFEQTVIHSHRNAYECATFDTQLKKLKESYVDSIELTVHTEAKTFPLSVRENDSVDYLLALCQLMDPNLIGKQMEMLFEEFDDDDCELRVFGPLVTDKRDSRLISECPFDQTWFKFNLRQEVHLFIVTEGQVDHLSPLTESEKSAQLESFTKLLPNVITDLSNNKSLIGYLRICDPELVSQIERDIDKLKTEDFKVKPYLSVRSGPMDLLLEEDDRPYSSAKQERVMLLQLERGRLEEDEDDEDEEDEDEDEEKEIDEEEQNEDEESGEDGDEEEDQEEAKTVV